MYMVLITRSTKGSNEKPDIALFERASGGADGADVKRAWSSVNIQGIAVVGVGTEASCLASVGKTRVLVSSCEGAHLRSKGGIRGGDVGTDGGEKGADVDAERVANQPGGHACSDDKFREAISVGTCQEIARTYEVSIAANGAREV